MKKINFCKATTIILIINVILSIVLFFVVPDNIAIQWVGTTPSNAVDSYYIFLVPILSVLFAFAGKPIFTMFLFRLWNRTNEHLVTYLNLCLQVVFLTCEIYIGLYNLDDNKLKQVCKIANENIKLNKNIQKLLDEKWKSIKIGNEKETIVGVHVRQTDKITPPTGHYAASDTEQYFVEIDKILHDCPSAKIFLCCDDLRTIECFKAHYGSCVFYNDAYRAEPGSTTGIHLDKIYHRENHKYLLGVEVIMDAYMLARCDYLIHTHSNVTNAAIIINGGRYRKRVFVG